MAGYSGNALVKKLGIKAGYRMYIHGAPAAYFDWISPLPEGVSVVEKLSGKFDFVHVFVPDEKAVRKVFRDSKRCLNQGGMIWVSWPKKSSGVRTDLSENSIRDVGLKEGLVDVKVCAVDDVWSALKFVIPLKDRV
jgi:hypothetical protein